HSLVRTDRKQVVNHLKGRGCARPMYARQIGEIVETRIAIASQKIADLDDARRVDVDGKLSNKLNRIANRVAELRFQFFDERVIARVAWLRPFVFLLYRWFRCARRSLIGGE